jgi:hypothetical protein
MFTLLPAPTGRDLVAILDRVIRCVARRLAREQPDDAAADESPPELFAQIQAEAATTWRPPATADLVRSSDRLRAWCDGFRCTRARWSPTTIGLGLNGCAATAPRPAFAHDRLAWTADGWISYRLKRPWPDGRTRLVLEPVAFLRRLVGIIPPPRRHLVRYAGMFGPASKARSKLRALIPVADPDDTANPRCPASGVPGVPTSTRARRLPMGRLLRRVFAKDVLHCPCGGHRSVTAFVVDERLACSLLTTLGSAAEPPPYRLKRPWPAPEWQADRARCRTPARVVCHQSFSIFARRCCDRGPSTFAPARDPPQAELWFDDASKPARPPTRSAGTGLRRRRPDVRPLTQPASGGARQRAGPTSRHIEASPGSARTPLECPSLAACAYLASAGLGPDDLRR